MNKTILITGATGFIDDEMVHNSKPIQNVPDNVPEKRLEFILKSIKSNKTIAIPALAEILQVDSKTIKRDLEKLKKKGLLTRIGPDKGGYWQINDEKKN